jgi:hypothetical protein
MKACNAGLLLCLLTMLLGCSREAVHRTTYGTLQNVGAQQCERELSAECPEPETYEEYQRKLKESEAERH